MKYYKDNSGKVYAFAADGSQDDFIPAELTAITEAEADALRFPALPREVIVATAWAAIKAERDRRKAGGVKVGAKWFHSDDASRIQQLALVMMGASLPAGLQWKTMDGSFITMTQALAASVLGAAVASDQVIFGAAETHRVGAGFHGDPASYDYSGGWPKVYGE